MDSGKKILFATLGVFLIIGLNVSAFAQGKEDYPNKPIQLISAWPPGNTDLPARVWAESAEKILGQPIVLINKPGAGGVPGTTYVVRAKADGYTLLAGAPGSNLVAPLVTKTEYDIDSFIPICLISENPCGLVVHAESPWKTLEQFVQDAKRDPGKLKFGSPMATSWVTLVVKNWAMQAGIKLKDIHFEGSGPAATALLGRHVDIILAYPQFFQPQVKAGTLRVLAIDATWEEHPEIPTFKNLGYKGNYAGWSGILAAKGTPSYIIDKLAETAKKVMNEPKFLEAMKKINVSPMFMGPEEWKKNLIDQYADLKKVVAGLDIQKK